MSQSFGLQGTCDYSDVSVRTILSWVGTPSNGRAAALTRVVSIGSPRWNTADGSRPTQAQADQMVDRFDAHPGIFTPVVLQVERPYSGSLPSTITAFAESGTIGHDDESSCEFGSSTRLQIRDTHSFVTPGDWYVIVFGAEIVPGRGGSVVQPTILYVFSVEGGKVIGLYGKPEPLP